MVSQAVKYTALAAPFAILWLSVVTEWVSLPFARDQWTKFNILVAPIYVVIALGIYAVTSVVYGVLTFNDCPEAYEELKMEIEEARNDLRKLGVDVK